MGGKRSRPAQAPFCVSSLEDSLLRADGNKTSTSRFGPEVSVHNQDGNSWGTKGDKLKSLLSNRAARLALISLGELNMVPRLTAECLAYELREEEDFMTSLAELKGAGLATTKTLTIECNNGENKVQTRDIWLLTDEGRTYFGRLQTLIDSDFVGERTAVAGAHRKIMNGAHSENVDLFKQVLGETDESRVASKLKSKEGDMLLPYDIRVLMVLMQKTLLPPKKEDKDAEQAQPSPPKKEGEAAEQAQPGNGLFQITPSLLSQIQQIAGREKKDVINSLATLVELEFVSFNKTVVDSLEGKGRVEIVILRCTPHCIDRIAALRESPEARKWLLKEDIVLDAFGSDSFVKPANTPGAAVQLQPPTGTRRTRQGSLGEFARGSIEGTA